MAETVKKYLDQAGLSYFIEKLVAGEVKGKGLTDNNFTDELLTKLNSTATTAGLQQLTNDVNELKALIEADSDGAINKFNEIVTFLAGIEDTKTLEGMFGDISTQLGTKVDKVTNKGLSTNDYDDAAVAEVAKIANKANSADVYTKTAADNKFVVKVTGKGLSTNDYTTADKNLVATISDKLNAADVPTALPNPSAIVLKLNGGTTEGTNQFTYNGSEAKSVNITAASVGAMTTAQLKTATFAAGRFAAKTYTPTTAATINVPTATSHLTNDSSFITLNDIPAITNAEIDTLISA